MRKTLTKDLTQIVWRLREIGERYTTTKRIQSADVSFSVKYDLFFRRQLSSRGWQSMLYEMPCNAMQAKKPPPLTSLP